jgi:AcrR family transcriptional regulator
LTLTESQQARHDRMLGEAARLAAQGGFDAVQMREVAAAADVALGTLYRYFPSKEHLLVSAMMRQIESLSTGLAIHPAEGATALDRVVDVLTRANLALQRQQNFTVAVVRSLASGDENVAPVVRQVRELMGTIILTAMTSSEPSERERLQAQLLQEIWLSALVAWISGVEDAASVTAKLTAAADLLLGSDR